VEKDLRTQASSAIRLATSDARTWTGRSGRGRHLLDLKASPDEVFGERYWSWDGRLLWLALPVHGLRKDSLRVWLLRARRLWWGRAPEGLPPHVAPAIFGWLTYEIAGSSRPFHPD
jgi:hypothetical protein